MKDFIIAGAGLTGSIIARELTNKGYTCLITDKRNHTAGNIHSQHQNGIETHTYGPHIFHTNSPHIWQYINQYTTFNNYQHQVKAINNGKLYTLPFNLQTIYEITGNHNPQEARQHLTIKHHTNPQNLEEQALTTLGTEIYETLIKHYTIKQWGKHPTQLPPSILKRIPIRNTFNDRYYNHQYEGIPTNGYTKMIQNIQTDIELQLDLTIIEANWKKYGRHLIYTGPIDQYYNNHHGPLEYRSLKFQHTTHNYPYHQGCAQINHCDMTQPYTRTIEHKHFTNAQTPHTIITHEHPATIEETGEPYYPIEDPTKLYNKYRAIQNPKVTFAGRLGTYKYQNMDQAIAAALKTAKLIMAP